MQLSDEDRRRIYEEEKARIEARQRIEAEQKQEQARIEANKKRQEARDKRNGTLVIIGAIIVVMIAFRLSGSPSSGPVQAPQTSIIADNRTGAEYFADAQDAVARGEYTEASNWIDKALERAPGTPKMLALKQKVDAKLQAKAAQETAAAACPFQCQNSKQANAELQRQFKNVPGITLALIGWSSGDGRYTLDVMVTQKVVSEILDASEAKKNYFMNSLANMAIRLLGSTNVQNDSMGDVEVTVRDGSLQTVAAGLYPK